MTIGIKVKPSLVNRVSNALEEADIDYGIHNIEEMLLRTAEHVEFTVSNNQDAQKLREIVDKITSPARKA